VAKALKLAIAQTVTALFSPLSAMRGALQRKRSTQPNEQPLLKGLADATGYAGGDIALLSNEVESDFY